MSDNNVVNLSDALINNELVSSDDWKVLNAFHKKAKRLIETKLVNCDEYRIDFRLSFDAAKEAEFTCKLPPEEIIAEFLMVFRFFYLQKEITHFPKVLKVLGKYNERDDARAGLKQLNARWKNCLFGNAMSFKLNGVTLTSSKLLDLWFNAHYFHSDEKKEQELIKQQEILPNESSKYMMIDSAIESTDLIFEIYQVVNKVVEQHTASSQ